LAYIDEVDGTWVCEDNNLTRNSDNSITGSTRHFTSFAIIFGSNDQGEQANITPCSNAPFPNKYIYAIVICGVAVFVVIFAVIIHHQIKKARKKGSQIKELRLSSTQ